MLQYNAERTKAVETLSLAASVVSVYDARLSGIEIEFVEFLFKGAWEVHFSHGVGDDRIEDAIVGDVLADPSTITIVATALSMLQRRLSVGRPIRYHAHNERLYQLYDQVFACLNMGEFAGNILRFETRSVHAASGVSVTSITLELDIRTLPLPSKRVDEGLRMMREASIKALRGEYAQA